MKSEASDGSTRRSLGSRLARIIPIAFYVLLGTFLIIYVIRTDWSALANLEFSWAPLLTATGLSLTYIYLGVFIWLRLLKRLGGKGLAGQGRELSYIYAKSWLGRYIPGPGVWILGKIYFAGKHGIPRDKLAVSGLLEGALQIVATMIVGVGLVLFDHRSSLLDPWARWALALTLLVSLIAIIPPVFNQILALGFRLLRRGTPDPTVLPSWGTIGEAAGLYIISSLITGTSYYFVILSIYPDLLFSDVLYVIGATGLGFAVSLLAIFAPGGLGVREGLLALLFGAIMPGPIALVVVIVIRLWSVAVDFIFFGIAWLLRPRRTHAVSSALDDA